MELISVIVPVYKVEAYLDRCVQSIVNQTYSDLEIILVDDGSPDNCGALCDKWAAKDRRVKVIHKENGGLSDARNAGLAAATGEYIAFVDSDDWLHPEFLSRLYGAVKKHGVLLSGCDYCATDTYHDEFDPVCGETSCHTPEQALGMLLCNRGYRAVAWNKLYHRSLLVGEAYPVGRYHEDEFFTYRIIDKAERLAYVDAPLYFYFQRPGSIMSSASIRHLDALDAYLERLRFLKEKYPALYSKDKVTVCTACVSFYREALQAKTEERKAHARKIRTCRKQVKVTFGEFCGLSLVQKTYVLGSCVPHLFCIVQNWLREKRNG